MTSFLIKSALVGSALSALARLALCYLRARAAQARERARFRAIADAELARHCRRPQRASRILFTRSTGPVICYRN